MVIGIRGILGASLPAVLCLAAVAAGQTAPTTSPAPADLKYIKKDTRAETLSATMAQYLPADVRLEPWRLVGPFDAPKNLEDALPPETGFDPQAHYTGKGGRPLSWQPADIEDGKVSSIAPAADAGKSAAFLDRQIVSKAPHYLTVDLGSSTPMVVWFNGTRVLKVDKARPCRIGDDELKLALRAGVNHLLVKTVHAEGPWEFGFGVAPTDPRLKAQLDYRLDADFPPTPEDAYYRIITVPVPDDVVLEVGGLEVLPGGRVAAATRRGEVWMIDDAYGKPPTGAKFSLFASGLHEPLGLVYKDGSLLTTQRGEVTRLKDTTGAGQADLYETVCDQWNVSGDYHEFAFGPKFDRNGDMWVTLNVGFMRGTDQSHVPWRGWAVKISPDGKMEPQAMGLRSPAGFCMNADGDMFFSDNQGEWVGACIIQPLRKGLISLHPSGWKWSHLPGSPIRDPGTPPKGLSVVEAAKAIPIHLPAVWIPYGTLMGQSSTDVVCDTTGGRFGPFDKQMFVGDENGSLINRIYMEKVGGDYQGACFPFRSGFECGVIRMAWADKDPTDPSAMGSMFVGMSNRGWGSRGNKPYGLQRLLWTGKTPFEMHEIHAQPDGFVVTFTKPVSTSTASDPASYKLTSWTYFYGPQYGSPEIEKKHPTVRTATVAPDAMSVRLVVDGLRQGYVHELELPGVQSADGEPLLHPEGFYTLNRIPGEPATAPAGEKAAAR